MAARKKQTTPATDGVLWRTKYKGTPIRLEMRDLTVQRLLQLKQWFGQEYAIPNQLLTLLFQQEAGAVMAAVWIGLQKAKKPVADARDLDFNFEDDFEALDDPQPVKGEDDPPTVPAEPTNDSAATS